MPLEIVACEQGTPEWFSVRSGLPTASEFKTILGVKKDAKEKLTRQAYMRKLAGEIITGEPMETYQNAHMERGKIMEDEARNFYCFTRSVEARRVGFIKNFGAGASPDSLVEPHGGLEIKTALAHIQIERLEKGAMPPEHVAQVQGNLWIAEREFWDFVSYCPKLPLFVHRVMRDEAYIAELAKAVEQFNEELQALVYRVRRYGHHAEKAA